MTKIFLLTSLIANAGQAEEATSKSWRSSLGIEGQYYQYREPNLMHLVGWMLGVNGERFYHFGSKLFAGVEGRALWGRADYSSNGTGRIKGMPQALFETRALAGYDYTLKSGSILSPYIGVGYRYKYDGENGKQSTTNHYSYKRQSHYFYLPMGLKYKIILMQDCGLVLRGEYDQLLYGQQKSDDLHGGNEIHDQYSGFGLKASIDVVKKLTNNRAMSFGPYLHYWNIKDSERNSYDRYYTWEPHNKTYEAGLSLKYYF